MPIDFAATTLDGNKVATVIGSDTYLGAHLVKYLTQAGIAVFEFPQNKDFTADIKSISPKEANTIYRDLPKATGVWIFICLDPEVGFEQYTVKVKKICDTLVSEDYSGDVCLLSSASLCMPEYDCQVTENTIVYPRNEHDLALATAENMLNVLACKQEVYITPHIMRIGVPYGNEFPNLQDHCVVNQMTANGKENLNIQIPMLGDSKRSLSHISDICQSVISLINAEYCPPLVNIPGEEMTFAEIGSAVAEKYHVSFCEKGLTFHDAKDFFAGDQKLSSAYFNELVTYTPKYAFKQWLTEQ